jgi:hypothetical protein
MFEVAYEANLHGGLGSFIEAITETHKCALGEHA